MRHRFSVERWRREVTAGRGLAVLAALATGVGVLVWGQTSNRAPSLPKGFRLETPIRTGSAADVARLSTKGYADASDSVVLAKCLDAKVDRGPGGNIFTYFSFSVVETIKGPRRASFRLRLFGGALENESVPMAIDRAFDPGKEYVLMLGRENADGFPTLTPAAIFTVQLEPESGRKLVTPCAQGIDMYEKSSGRRLRVAPDWCFADDFAHSLKKAIE